MLFVKDDDTIEQSFLYDHEPLAELSKILINTAKLLSAAHTGLRVELAGGL